MRLNSVLPICESFKCRNWTRDFSSVSSKSYSTETQKLYGASTPPEELLKIALNPYVPKSAQDLANRLSKEIIFHRPGDVLAINKPYGVSSTGRRHEKRGIFKNNLEGFEPEERKDSSVTLEDALPLLGEHLKEKGLHFCVGLKRYTAGPVVLPCSKKAFEKIKNSLSQATFITNSGWYMYKVLAICMQKPQKSSGTVYGYATYEDSHDAKEFVFVPDVKADFHARATNKAVQGMMRYDVLATKHGLSLVDLHFTKWNRHLPRLMMSHLGAPIFGDNLYGRRMIRVGDELASVRPKDLWRSKETGTEYVPEEFMKLISKDEKDYVELKPQIPMCMAVYETDFPRFNNPKDKHTGLILRIPPPDHFYAMSKLLGFESIIKKHMNSLGKDQEYEPIHVHEGDE